MPDNDFKNAIIDDMVEYINKLGEIEVLITVTTMSAVAKETIQTKLSNLINMMTHDLKVIGNE